MSISRMIFYIAILKQSKKSSGNSNFIMHNMSIKFFFVYLSVAALFVLSGDLAQCQSDLRIIHRDKARNLTLEGSLQLLNLCQEQPDYIQEIFKTAFNAFSVDPGITFSDLARDPDFLRLCTEHGMSHTGGPMLGNISSQGASIWLRTLEPANVEVRVTMDGSVKTYGPVSSSEKTDLTAVVHISGLKPSTSYPYEVLINGKPVNSGIKPAIRTSPVENSPAKARIAFGSCYHRWGLCNQNLANQIISRNPLALLLGGDIAVQDRNNDIAMHRADYLLRDFQVAWKNMVSSVPVYATWDDHDYFDDDLHNIPEGFTREDKEAVWKVFRDSWNNPSYGLGDEGKGVFFRTRIGPADVIMLDGRYFREKGSFLGNEQMEWLKEQLLDCKGPFIILSNSTMWSDYVSNGKDSWGVYDPGGRELIFRLIEENNIGGVLLISGDRHGARGFTIPGPSGFTFYEFEVGSLGGRVGPPPINAEWDSQLFGVSGEYAFGEFDFDTTLPDPEVTFRLIDERGTVLYELTLTKSQLTPQSCFLNTGY